jgi:hypothetical protein
VFGLEQQAGGRAAGERRGVCALLAAVFACLTTATRGGSGGGRRGEGGVRGGELIEGGSTFCWRVGRGGKELQPV